MPETANGLQCGTCYTSFGDEYAVLAVPSIAFPGGVQLARPGHDDLCGTCHSGRASKASIDAPMGTASAPPRKSWQPTALPPGRRS